MTVTDVPRTDPPFSMDSYALDSSADKTICIWAGTRWKNSSHPFSVKRVWLKAPKNKVKKCRIGFQHLDSVVVRMMFVNIA
jgi:hypothetical protein